MKSLFRSHAAQMMLFAAVLALSVTFGWVEPANAMMVGFGGATLAANQLTLADWASRLDPNGRVPAIAELLSQTNDIMEDAVHKEGNLPTGERVVIRTGLPTVYFRLLNAGVPTSKSTTAQVDEACAMMEARSHIDAKLLVLNGNSASFRLSEDSAFLEAMNQACADAMFYGNPSVDPKTILGLATRYGAIAGVGNSQNVLDAGGTGSNNTSIWLVVWNTDTVYCHFPKGSTAGLMHRDLGEESVQDSGGNWYQAARTLYQWDIGLVVKDWRYVVRICNINVTDLASQSGTQASTANTEIIKLMSRAMDRIPNLSKGRAAFYANRTVYSYLRIMALNKSQNAVTIETAMNQFGTPYKMTSFLGVPLRKVDRLLNTEARVV